MTLNLDLPTWDSLLTHARAGIRSTTCLNYQCPRLPHMPPAEINKTKQCNFMHYDCHTFICKQHGKVVHQIFLSFNITGLFCVFIFKNIFIEIYRVLAQIFFHICLNSNKFPQSEGRCMVPPRTKRKKTNLFRPQRLSPAILSHLFLCKVTTV